MIVQATTSEQRRGRSAPNPPTDNNHVMTPVARSRTSARRMELLRAVTAVADLPVRGSLEGDRREAAGSNGVEPLPLLGPG